MTMTAWLNWAGATGALLCGVLLCGLGAAPAARAANPMGFVRAGDWTDATAAVADAADPVARKLVLFYRLLAPGAATPDQISAFLAANPDWPDRWLLERRRAEALVRDGDDADASANCLTGPIALPAALARCADALAATGRAREAAAMAGRAWAEGLSDPALVGAFLRRWSAALTPAEEWARFRTLLRRDPRAAAAELPRLAPPRRAEARARLALIRNAPNALALLRDLPPAARDAPALILAEAGWLRRTGQAPASAPAPGADAAALALWRAKGFAAEQAAPPDARAAFWAERAVLARALLADGDSAGAYAAAADRAQTAPRWAASADFLAGFIALTRLHDPDRAVAWFRRLGAVSDAAITRARAGYWLGRAEAAAGRSPIAAWRAAAAWPTTFYGQLAARALGEDPAALIDAARDPIPAAAEAHGFTAQEPVRAALLLTAWGDPGLARVFLLRAAELAPDAGGQALAAHLALSLDLPETAVFIARRMGMEGRALPQAGWPMPVRPPPGPPAGAIDPAVTLALIRQESSFDRGVVSPAGARGLMQLLPGTADEVAKRIGATVSLVSLTTDAARNMQLGTAYLARLLDRYDGSLPLAVAAYNAGPHRVDAWLAQNGDPRAKGETSAGASAMIDWIERIPFAETRNYVERVLENVVVYQARRHESRPALLAQWMPPAAVTGPAATTAQAGR